ncbi:F0F1 ATP synthase subunit alpha [Candidatus Roizmanbacteria bacterium RIFCSPHIGHO2_01_FULL_39_12c]|uniref:ATP synthase subunit alpha n=1 Tax=Candidatus Roizmanbacteria bacterium RIFCSPHIGHO2_01_FULL_39_12c TaxID=1802031 RepID=A0A1F7GER2_9BACT|nr:MAG: F0F1 ATP synthase subunit alpha [Candidatus Roizmanbacteria bacterium RIFCSPHIGHO2_01_FULL_39_12c]OGK48100.1 MAG: F0F1 ATP synthase subunit alpha [Candidatus Roizmanbacteria bacterium RIFCSPLOWO2_01_FULL_40_13]
MKLLDQYLQAIDKDERFSKFRVKAEQYGTVKEVKDGVTLLSGLQQVAFGELVEFTSGSYGYVIDLSEDRVGVIVLGDYLKISAGDEVKALGYTLAVPVGEALLGRVVNPLGEFVDGKESIKVDKFYPVEKIAPSVVKRKPVNVPLHTGIKAVDALIPIGRGQRELIVGDRGTGKTTIALDTIISQKKEGVICIYCAVGQKNSKIAQVIELLRKNEALDYTIVVNASATDPVSQQYLAPYSACAIGEYFMDKGKDVLVVYDDLTKHAWAYRQISLILRRPAGREAYPGDIFYLHSRLLERACRLNEDAGGGSLTALPIVETLEGDISSYIPTNIISITDGQMFLETDLFNAGIRPALNVGISVSRVGGNAQTKAMKQVAGRLKLDLAQYREMAAFSQFESELDQETKKFLNRGAKLTHVLIQAKNLPYSLAEEVMLIWAGGKGYLDDIPIRDINQYETRLMSNFKSKGKQLLEKINKMRSLSEEDEKALEKIVTATLTYFKN